ncbi:hypothetical protein [Leptospira mayottensis]|uniref:hypothetical protein n=1 Tax=Leptospira mayottensis TaxID=1137606 RepID=UPI000E35EECB|nr:hypothetical protein [Leptospira mayottensis]AXR68712.1 hypothetical protein DPV73_12565 [Leptospira mayottensis]
MDNRYELLHKLVNLETPIDQIKKGLSFYDWDSEINIELNSNHICNIIQKYLDGNLTNNEVEEWANLIEGREDISFEVRNQALLQNIIFDLANPELTEQLTIKKGRDIIYSLKA